MILPANLEENAIYITRERSIQSLTYHCYVLSSSFDFPAYDPLKNQAIFLDFERWKQFPVLLSPFYPTTAMGSMHQCRLLGQELEKKQTLVLTNQTLERSLQNPLPRWSKLLAREKAGASSGLPASNTTLPKLGFRLLHVAAFTKTHSKLSKGFRGKWGRTKTAREQNKSNKKYPQKNPKHCAEIVFPFQVTE